MADIVSVTMPLLSLTVAISTRAGPAEDDLPLYYRNRSRLFARERVELLIELFWEVLEQKTFGYLLNGDNNNNGDRSWTYLFSGAACFS